MTFVKWTQPAQRNSVNSVKGTAIAARSHTLLVTFIRPLSLVCTNSVEKKFFTTSAGDLEGARESYSYECSRQVYECDNSQYLHCRCIFRTPFC